MFIGSTTGVIVALEKGIEVVHICFDSSLSHTRKIYGLILR